MTESARRCRKEYMREYAKKNRVHLSEVGAKYREENRDKIRETHRKFRENNIEKRRASSRQYQKDNPELYKRYRKEHRKEIAEYRVKHHAKYVEKEPELYDAYLEKDGQVNTKADGKRLYHGTRWEPYEDKMVWERVDPKTGETLSNIQLSLLLHRTRGSVISRRANIRKKLLLGDETSYVKNSSS